MLPGGALAGASTGRWRTVRWRNAEHDLDTLVVNLDASHKGANNLPSLKPVKVVQPLADPLRKLFEMGDDQRQLALSTTSGSAFRTDLPIRSRRPTSCM